MNHCIQHDAYSADCDGCTTAANAAHCRAYRLANLDAQRERERVTQAAYRKANPDKVRENHLVRKYGITLQQRADRLAAQGGCCALCGSDDFGVRGPQVDHDHQSKQLRGILCIGCNLGLGAFDDDPQLMRKAADYVERYRGQFEAGLGAGLL